MHCVLRARGRDALPARRHGRQPVYARARDHLAEHVGGELVDRRAAPARRPRHQYPAARRGALAYNPTYASLLRVVPFCELYQRSSPRVLENHLSPRVLYYVLYSVFDAAQLYTVYRLRFLKPSRTLTMASCSSVRDLATHSFSGYLNSFILFNAEYSFILV